MRLAKLQGLLWGGAHENVQKLEEISNQDRTAPRLRGWENLLKEIESCHGWINPVIVGHVS